jgi:peptidoglycan/xylan/chitin deacetylase (PgdA/CDA1 family)/ubiquinone/menaquinone biosynthesis C-methylase UbiE
MIVSVIIPAHNAAGTLAETLESLRIQTCTDWEAIVVDDGSSDETVAIAAGFAQKDHRVRVVSQPKAGVGAARNTGVGLARYEWLLFLDADDWLVPQYFERMTHVLVSDSGIDAVYCHWARVARDGTLVSEDFRRQTGDMFSTFARGAVFPVHACIVRRAIVESVGGFDTSLRTCEDWDLWQRIARTGAQFGAIEEILALYRMQPASALIDGFQMLADGLRVVKHGHAPDIRVKNPHPDHANGLPVEQLPGQVFYFLCWCVGLVIGCGKDARSLLNLLEEYNYPGLDPYSVAQNIYRAAVLPTCQTAPSWIELWPKVEHHIDEYLLALEKQAKANCLARRARVALEHMILKHVPSLLPLTVGSTHAARIEVTEPIKDIFLPASVERLRCNIESEGFGVGLIELPVFNGFVPGYVLADAIAAEFAWIIIRRFFEHTVYPKLNIRQESAGLSLWRGSLCLAKSLPGNVCVVKQQTHETVGWTVFLQEIWGRPDWAIERFYDAQTLEEGMVVKVSAKNNWVTIEVSEDIPDVEVSGRELNVLITAGGAALTVATLPVQGNIVHAQGLRVTITDACGMELCRVAVREGLIGRSMNNQPSTLKERLAAAAEAVHGHGKGSVFERHSFTAGTTDILRSVIFPGEHAIVFGRRAYGDIGTSISRRAMLPAAVAPELIEAATIAGEPVIQIPEPCTNPSRVVYVPELIVRSSLQGQESIVGANTSEMEKSCDTPVFGHDYFEKVFAARPDPWKYTSPYEQKKYEQTLEMLPPGRIGRALEIACAEGHFTVKLATRTDHLIAADISQTALGRAAKRCSNMKNMRFVQLDLNRDTLPGRFELIVCSEMLYYVGGQDALKAIARKLAKVVEPWGYLLTAHAYIIKDDPDHTGFDWDNVSFGAKVIGETFAGISSLRLVRELRTPLYRIQLFQHIPRIYSYFYRSAPEIIELKQQPTELLPEVAVHVKWRDRSREENADQSVGTERLPILMYHRVAPTGLPETARYRVTPESFEEQLRYLRNAGYYSISLEDWRTAMEKKRPLPGRAVVITFDDGYVDFQRFAWPLLKRYGFSATVFIVAGLAGRINIWDSAYKEEIPLLGWKDIRQLQDEGVTFGSHSVSHPFLTVLSAEEVVREGARARAILGRELGVIIKAFAYPYGDVDRVVQHCIGACGYIFGLSTRKDMSTFHDLLLELPRIEVYGSDRIKDFVEKLGVQSDQGIR